jgi:hypothetical protein
VSINKTVPRVSPPPARPVFSEAPTAVEIRTARVFTEPLLPIGVPTAAENAALARAVTAYVTKARASAIEPFTAFLREYPSGAWRASLLVNVGGMHRTAGFLTRALRAWDEAWSLAKDETSMEGRAIADTAAANALDTLATLGHLPGLERWLERTSHRAMTGSAQARARRAREARALIAEHPEHTIASGPKALEILWQWRAGTSRATPRDGPPRRRRS